MGRYVLTEDYGRSERGCTGSQGERASRSGWDGQSRSADVLKRGSVEPAPERVMPTSYQTSTDDIGDGWPQVTF